jgi:hypothetical protein
VDTPGLGSVLAHSEATSAWMPNVAAALVTVSAERPLAEADRRLLTEARQSAPRVVVLLTKIDLLTDAELAEVTAFLQRGIIETLGTAIPVLPFSCRSQTERWLRQLQDTVLSPLAGNVASERQTALAWKGAALVQACRGYLSVGLQVAERAAADRDRLRAAVLNRQSVRRPGPRLKRRFSRSIRRCTGDSTLHSLPNYRVGKGTWPCRAGAMKSGWDNGCWLS